VPVPPGMVFLIFATKDYEIFEFRWERMNATKPGFPTDYETRFTSIRWSLSSNPDRLRNENGRISPFPLYTPAGDSLTFYLKDEDALWRAHRRSSDDLQNRQPITRSLAARSKAFDGSSRNSSGSPSP